MKYSPDTFILGKGITSDIKSREFQVTVVFTAPFREAAMGPESSPKY